MSVVGTTRRLQALCCLGYNRTMLEQVTGIPRSAISASIRETGKLDSPELAAMYPSLLHGPDSPKNRIIQEAHRLGYLPPSAWTEETIDDPGVELRTRTVRMCRTRPLRGQELTTYVATELARDATADAVSLGAGYSNPQRCALALSRCSQAHLGRALLQRLQRDEADAAFKATFSKEVAAMMNQMVG